MAEEIFFVACNNDVYSLAYCRKVLHGIFIITKVGSQCMVNYIFVYR